MTLRTRAGLFGLLLGFAAVAGCTTKGPGGGSADKWNHHGPHVLTSFPPLYCLAATVAGDDAAVRVVMCDGPHEHEFKSSDAENLPGATIFFINGLGLDDHVAKKMLEHGGANVKLVALGEKLPKGMLREMDEEDDDKDKKPDDK